MEPNAVLQWIECHPGLSGYLQAVGTVLAILVAFYAPSISRWLDRRHARRLVVAASRQFMRSLRPAYASIENDSNKAIAALDAQTASPAENELIMKRGAETMSLPNDWFNLLLVQLPPQLDYMDQHDFHGPTVESARRIAQQVRDYNNRRAEVSRLDKDRLIENWNELRRELLTRLAALKNLVATTAVPQRVK